MPQPSSVLRELLTVKQVAHQLDVSARTIWRYLARKQFPEPIRFSRKQVRWRVGDIRTYLERMASGQKPL